MEYKIATQTSVNTKEIKNKKLNNFLELKGHILEFKEVDVDFSKTTLKDVKKTLPCYVGGSFLNQQKGRVNKNIQSRCLLTLDIDDTNGIYANKFEELKADISSELEDYQYLVHTTISHKNDMPKLRIIIPLDSDITGDEYKDLSKKFVEKLSFKESVDKASYKSSQAMFIAVKPIFKNAPKEYAYKYQDWRDENMGEHLDIAKYLEKPKVENQSVVSPIVACNDNNTNMVQVNNSTNDISKPDSDSLEIAIVNNPFEQFTDQDVGELLNNIPVEELEYQDWVSVGMGLHHQYRGAKKGLTLWDKWSAEDVRKKEDGTPMYDQGECIYKWGSFSNDKSTAVSILKLVQLARIYNDGKLTNDLEKKIKQTFDIKLELFKDKLRAEVKSQTEELEVDYFRREIYKFKKEYLHQNITADKKVLGELDNILANIKTHNDLLDTNYEEDIPYSIEDYMADLNLNTDGLSTGYSNLDKYVRLQPKSLVFITGRPSHGKTTMMLNLLRNMIKNNPDKAFLFYSYEEQNSEILSKIILCNIEGNDFANEGENKLALVKKQLKVIANNNNKDIISTPIEKSYGEVKEWLLDDRLQIMDRKVNAEILSGAILERVKKSKKPIVSIFVDYVQKLKGGDNAQTRQLEIQSICQTMLNTALHEKVNATVIMGAQLNRDVISLNSMTLDNMRESGDIEQDANLVLGVWDEQAGNLDNLRKKLEKLEKKDKPKKNIIKDLEEQISKIEVQTMKDLKIKILKNRNGRRDVVVKLKCESDRFLVVDEEKKNYQQISDKIAKAFEDD